MRTWGDVHHSAGARVRETPCRTECSSRAGFISIHALEAFASAASKRSFTQSASGRIRTPSRSHNWAAKRSEEHTSELQSRLHLVCRLLLENKKFSPNNDIYHIYCH